MEINYDNMRADTKEQFADGQAIIDNLMKIKTGAGISTAMTDIFTGANITGTVPAIKPNTNNHGYVFMTRPDLNLSPDNCRLNRNLMQLASANENSMLRAIAMMLSPQLANRFRGIKSNLVDNRYPFLSISDNLVRSLTGWPSAQLGISTTPAGVNKGEHIQADSPAYYNGQFSLSLSTYDIVSSPVKRLYHYWTTYIGALLDNAYGLAPWPEYWFNGRLDYTTRVYRLIMDESRTYVEEIAATNYAIPQVPDLGPHFNFDAEQPRPFVGGTLNVELACSGAIYFDELLVLQFNRTVELFNPAMRDHTADKRDKKPVRSIYMVKVEKRYHGVFSGKAFPRIDPQTKELEWYVSKETWKAMQHLVKMVDSYSSPIFL